MLPVSQQHQLVSVINEREDHRPFCKPKCLEQPPTKLGPTAQPAPRAEVAVLFLLQEAPILLRAKRGEFFFRESKKFGDQLAYYSSFKKCAFGAIFRLRAKFSKKWPPKLGTTAQPAPRAEVAVLFLLQEPPTKVSFSREARRIFFSRNCKILATNSLTKVLLKSVRLEHFFGFGQNFRKCRPPNSGPQPSRRLEQRWLYYFLYGSGRPNSGPQPSRRLEQRWLYYFLQEGPAAQTRY